MLRAIFCLLTLYLCIGLAPSKAQDTQPYTITVDALTSTNVIQVDVDQQATDGISGRMTIETSLPSLYFSYRIDTIGDVTINPASNGARVWDFLGLIPTEDVAEEVGLLPSEGTLQYDVTFSDPSGKILITGYALGGRGVAFNAVTIAFRAIPALSGYSTAQIGDLFVENAELFSQLLAVADSVNCVADDAPPQITDFDNCLLSIDAILGNVLLHQLVSELAAAIAPELAEQVTTQSVGNALAAVDLTRNVRDAALLWWSLYRGGTIVNQYEIYPVVQDPRFLTPWPPHSLYPSGFALDRQPGFEWQGITKSGDYYELQIDTEPEFTSPVIDVSITTMHFDLPIVLDANSTYYWRVRAVNSLAAEPSAWSTAAFITGDEQLTVDTCGQIAFVTDRDGNQEIYVMNADGTEARNLSNRPYTNDFAPVWSPDGSMVAFVSQVDGTDFSPYVRVNLDLFIVNSDGSGMWRITSTPDYAESEPQWSPDGSQIAFMSSSLSANWEGQHVIYNIKTGERVEIPLLEFDGTLSWSPDGSRLTLSRRVGDTQYRDIYVMNTDGENPSQVMNTKVVVAPYAPSWSPDGTRIAFAADIYSDSSLLIDSGAFTINNDGADLITLVSNITSHNSPIWSPTGDELVIVSLNMGEGGGVESTEILVVDQDGDDVLSIINDGNLNYTPSWSPTGTALVFAGFANPNSGEAFSVLSGELFTISSAGGNLQNITNTESSETDPDWSPTCEANSYVDVEDPRLDSLQLSEGHRLLLFNDDVDEIWLRSEPDSMTNNFTTVPSGTIAEIIATDPYFDGTQNWYHVRSVVGQNQGWVEQSTVVALNQLNQDYFDTFCPGAGGYHFAHGQRFIVPFGDGPTSIWSEPNSEPRVGRVNEGEGGYIVSGPECRAGQSGNLLAWYVVSDTGLEGWMSEGYTDSVVPWIIPLPEYQP